MSSLTMPVCAVAVLALALGARAMADSSAAGNKYDIGNPNHCKIVERKPSEQHASGGLSTSVTAGNGHVSAHTSGGNSVTVHSANGNVSSSVATTGSGNDSTTVTTSDGNCIIYVNPGQKKEH